MSAAAQNAPQAPTATTANAQPAPKTTSAPGPTKGKSKGKPQKSGGRGQQQKTTSGFTATLRSSAQAVAINFVPERNFYLVNVARVISFFAKFDSFVRGLSRRSPGHPNLRLYFVLCMWGLLGKLARVGVATAQIALLSTQIPDTSWLRLPPVILQVIDSFGEYLDPKLHINIAPRVTLGILNHLQRIIVSAMTVANIGVSVNPSNHLDYLLAYSDVALHTAIAARMTASLGIPTIFSKVNSMTGFRRAASRSLIDHTLALNNGLPQNFEPARVIGTHIDSPQQAPVHIGEMFTEPQAAPIINALALATAEYTPAADPFPNVDAQNLIAQVSSIFPTVAATSVFSIMAHVSYLSTIFDLQPLTNTVTGTLSACCVTEAAGSGFTVSCTVASLDVQTAIIGSLLQNNEILFCNPAGIFYELSSVDQTVRCHTTEIATSPDSLLVRAFSDARK